MTVPFQYRSLGIGGGPELNVIIVEKGKELQWVSRSLLMGIQDLQFSVTEIKDISTSTLQPHHKYSTDRVPLDPNQILQHNQAYPSLAIPPDFSYSIRHDFSFDLSSRERSLSVVIESHLYYKARLAPDFKEYGKAYSGQFFSQRVLDAFQKELGKKQ